LEEIIQSKFYADWFDEQMPEIQKLAQRGNAQDCLFVLQKYDHDMALRYGRQEPPKEQPKQEQKPVDEKVAKLQESRDKRVNAAGVTPKQTPAAVNKEELDPNAIFEKAFSDTIKSYRR
jgi:Rod binding domain-containing protein